MNSIIQSSNKSVAIIGTGMIGRSWAISFARSGYKVHLYDQNRSATQLAVEEIRTQAEVLARKGLLNGYSSDQLVANIVRFEEIDHAVRNVIHVQENVPEIIDIKKKIFAELDEKTPAGATIASSSSAILPSKFLDGIKGQRRCLVAHPLNPPHLVPAVEIVPAPGTAKEAVTSLANLMRSIGQEPIVLSREIEGFVMNRLQSAVLEEAFRLVEAGVVTSCDLDKAIKDGLGLRWSFMGPIETIDLNAPEGVADFIDRYDAVYSSIDASKGPRISWKGRLAKLLESERRKVLPKDQLYERQVWRDDRLMALAVNKLDTVDNPRE